jgi:5-methylcytosine-specific restriction endonuclease McrA
MEPLAIDRRCLREPIREITDAAHILDAAVSAHLVGQRNLAEKLIRSADTEVLRDYGESLWGSKINNPYVQSRVVLGAPPTLPREHRVKNRMPTSAIKKALFQRDGYHCRFCGIPVIPREVVGRIRKAYPEALPWGRRNIEKHAAFLLMCAEYDHIVPHARGGNNDLDNIVITCAGCNYGRIYGSVCRTLEEQNLLDPRGCDPVRSTWDGLTRFH